MLTDENVPRAHHLEPPARPVGKAEGAARQEAIARLLERAGSYKQAVQWVNDTPYSPAVKKAATHELMGEELRRAALRPPPKVEFGEAKFRSSPIEVVPEMEHKFASKDTFLNAGFEPRYDLESLQETKDRKIQALLERLDSDLFRERLSEQGLSLSPRLRRKMRDEVKKVPVKADWGTLSGGGSITKGRTTWSGFEPFRVTLYPDAGNSPKEHNRTLSHELEHVFDENYRSRYRNLSSSQRATLHALSGRDKGERKKYPRSEDLGHVRISVMLAREALGKEILTTEDVKRIMENKDKNSEFKLLQKLLKEGAKHRPVDELTRLLNLVAEQQVDDGTRTV